MLGSVSTLGLSVTVLVGAVLTFYLVRHRKSLRRHTCRSTATLSGKTVVVTGANSGIGYETALELAKRKARVILACRNVEQGEKAALSIRKEISSQDVIFYRLDLASFASIHDFAKKVLEQESAVHILINNAGVVYPDYQPTQDGLELHMGVNHLGHFLLTVLLLEKLKSSQPSRIINVSSLLYKNCEQFDFENMNSSNPSRMDTRPNRHIPYCQSKLANILFTRELARRLEGTGVTANVVSPGMVHTRLGRHSLAQLPFLLKPLAYLALSLLFKTSWEGAQTVIHCAVSEEVEGVSGKFFRDCQQTPLLTAVSRNEHVAKKLWDVSTSLVGLDHDLS